MNLTIEVFFSMVRFFIDFFSFSILDDNFMCNFIKCNKVKNMAIKFHYRKKKSFWDTL